MSVSRALLPLLALPLALAFACGGAADPSPAPTPDPATPSPSAATPAATPTASSTATASPAPAWWEDEDGEAAPAPPGRPQSRVWNVRVEALSEDEVTVSFDYLLDLAPEANVFVHMNLLPGINLGLLDAAGDFIGGFNGELDPTEFGDDEVGGQATFTVATSRFEEVVAVSICIRVVTGNYDDFMGRTEIFCEPVPAERVAP